MDLPSSGRTFSSTRPKTLTSFLVSPSPPWILPERRGRPSGRVMSNPWGKGASIHLMPGIADSSSLLSARGAMSRRHVCASGGGGGMNPSVLESQLATQRNELAVKGEPSGSQKS
eukprot:1319615-Rhodomonas_salina.1